LRFRKVRRRSATRREPAWNKAALDHVVYAPLGVSIRHFAWRKNVVGIGQGPLPFSWGVSKTV
jgi:hypothetical protein